MVAANPRPVVIPCMGVSGPHQIASLEARSWWFYPAGNRAIQGALVTREGQQRVYMVTEARQTLVAKG